MRIPVLSVAARFGQAAFGVLILHVLTLATHAVAAGFSVSPIRLDFDRSVKTGLVNVTNNDSRRLTFQVRLVRWTQDAKGQDLYEESEDLVYFPRAITLEPNARQIVRVGSRGAPQQKEQTYRLFIEEMPDPNSPTPSGAQVAVRVRFGVPLFVAPEQPSREVVSEGIRWGSTGLVIKLKNPATQSVRFENLTAWRGDRELGKADGWYVLAGATREFNFTGIKEACDPKQPLRIVGNAGEYKFERTFQDEQVTCSP